jgi:hypothetical protein
MAEIRGRYDLQLNFPGDGRCFLNFWDHERGNDVIAEIIDRQMILNIDGGEIERPTDIFEFIQRVKDSISHQRRL